jgi:hypothetical protein
MMVLRITSLDLETRPGAEQKEFCSKVLEVILDCNDCGLPFDGEVAQKAMSTLERYISLQQVEIALLLLHEQGKIKITWMGIGGEVLGAIVPSRT